MRSDMHRKSSSNVCGGGSIGIILAMGIARFREVFRASSLGPFQKAKEK
jgi:hypothetical protein